MEEKTKEKKLNFFLFSFVFFLDFFPNFNFFIGLIYKKRKEILFLFLNYFIFFKIFDQKMAEPKDSPVDELLRAEDEANKVIAEAKAEQLELLKNF